MRRTPCVSATSILQSAPTLSERQSGFLCVWLRNALQSCASTLLLNPRHPPQRPRSLAGLENRLRKFFVGND